MSWFRKAANSVSPEIIVGSYLNIGDGLLTIYIDRKKYEFYMNPSEKKEFERRLKYNKGRALAYLRELEKQGKRFS